MVPQLPFAEQCALTYLNGMQWVKCSKAHLDLDIACQRELTEGRGRFIVIGTVGTFIGNAVDVKADVACLIVFFGEAVTKVVTGMDQENGICAGLNGLFSET